MVIYSRSDLLQLSSQASPVTRPTRKTLFMYQLWADARARRFTRKVISSLFSFSDSLSSLSSSSASSSSLTTCPSTLGLQCGLLNARSIRNKTASIQALISDFGLDCLVITETCHESSTDVCIKRCTPSGYRCLDVPRRLSMPVVSDRQPAGGGVAVIYRYTYTMKTIDIGFLPTSFEFSCSLRYSSRLNTFILTIYRPGSAPITDQFFFELNAVVGFVFGYSTKLLILGDFNVHVERDSDPAAAKFKDILSSFGLQQHVSTSTHEHGGTLDLLITPDNFSLSNITVHPDCLRSLFYFLLSSCWYSPSSHYFFYV